MNASWVETAGRWSLYLYFAVITVTLVALAVRFVRLALSRHVDEPRAGGEREPADVRAGAAWALGGAGESPDRPGARIGRFLVEYLGNVGPDARRAGWPAVERRRNPQARLLMDRIKQEMGAREVPPSEAEQRVQELRDAMRAEGQEPAG